MAAAAAHGRDLADQFEIPVDVVGEETDLAVSIAPADVDVGRRACGGQESRYLVMVCGAPFETFYLCHDDFSFIFAAVGCRGGLLSMEECLQGLAVRRSQSVLAADGQGNVRPCRSVDPEGFHPSRLRIPGEGENQLFVILFLCLRGAPLALRDNRHSILDTGGRGRIIDGEQAATFRDGFSCSRVGDEEVVARRRRSGNLERSGSASAEKACFGLGDRAVRGDELEVGNGAEIALTALSVHTEQREIYPVSGYIGTAIRCDV